MRNFLLIIALMTFMQSELCAINIYFKGDTLTVWADEGLSIRAINSISGEKIGLIPYGAKLIVQADKVSRREEEKIELASVFQDKKAHLSLSLHGQWVKITYGEIEGYVFDGYLSKHPAPLLNKDEEAENLHDYIYRVFGLIHQKEAIGADALTRRLYFGSGVSIFNLGTKTAYLRYILPGFSQEEIVLFIKNSSKTNPDGELVLIEDSFIENGNIRILKFSTIDDDNWQIIIKILSGMVILESESSC